MRNLFNFIVFTGLIASTASGNVNFVTRPDYSSSYRFLPEYQDCNTIELNGNWQYTITEEDFQGSVAVPCNWEDCGDGTVKLSRKLKLEESYRDKKITLVITGLYRRCRIFLNEELAAEAEGPYVKETLPPKLLKFGKNNIIEIEIDNVIKPLTTIPVLNGSLRPADYTGIFGDVFLLIDEKTSVKNMSITTEVDDSRKSGVIDLEFSLDRPPQNKPGGRAIFNLTDFSGKRISDFSWILTDEKNYSAEIKINAPELWDTENPLLYTAELWLEYDSLKTTSIRKKIGFRTFTVEDKYYLNGEVLQIRGVTYIPENKYGRIFCREDVKRDIETLTPIRANAIFIKEPAPLYFYELCDSLGILVFQGTYLNGIPNTLMMKEVSAGLCRKHLNELTESLESHCSVVSWVINSSAEVNLIEDSIIGLVKGLSRTPVFVEATPGDNYLIPVNSSGDFIDKAKIIMVGELLNGNNDQSQIIQAEKLQYELDKVVDANGIFIETLFDYRTNRPLLFAGPGEDLRLNKTGLMDADRKSRLAYRRLQNDWFTNSTVIPVKTTYSSPVFYPIAGIIFLIAGLLFSRNNKVFRLLLKRAFGHSHGFFVDIRNGRYIQKSQTFFIGIGASIIMGFILSAVFHYYRLTPVLDNGIGHLFFGCNTAEPLIKIIWAPFKSLLFFTLLSFLILAAGILVFHLVSVVMKGKTSLSKASTIVFWSFVPMIVLTPLTIVFYKGLYFPIFRFFMFASVGCCIFWSVLRTIYALRVASLSSNLKTWILFLAFNFLIAGIIYHILQYKTGIFYYFWYFISTV